MSTRSYGNKTGTRKKQQKKQPSLEFRFICESNWDSFFYIGNLVFSILSHRTNRQPITDRKSHALHMKYWTKVLPIAIVFPFSSNGAIEFAYFWLKTCILAVIEVKNRFGFNEIFASEFIFCLFYISKWTQYEMQKKLCETN